MEKNRRIMIAALLALTIGNFTKIKGKENIKALPFILIFIIGALAALLINDFVILFKAKREKLFRFCYQHI